MFICSKGLVQISPRETARDAEWWGAPGGVQEPEGMACSRTRSVFSCVCSRPSSAAPSGCPAWAWRVSSPRPLRPTRSVGDTLLSPPSGFASCLRRPMGWSPVPSRPRTRGGLRTPPFARTRNAGSKRRRPSCGKRWPPLLPCRQLAFTAPRSARRR
eukprot:scaffold1573_cov125-Isochrysis_galbana.AAC.1